MNDEEAQDALKRVIAIIEAENVPTDLRPTAFDHIWSAITGSTTAAPPAGAEPPPPGGDGTNGVAAFAAKLGVEARAMEDVFGPEDDGTFRVHVAVSKLAGGQKPGTEQLALLVCAGRQFAGEDKTPANAVREVCNEYAKLNNPNFAKTLRALDKLFIISGSGKQMTLKLRRTGWEEAGRLVGELAGQ